MGEELKDIFFWGGCMKLWEGQEGGGSQEMEEGLLHIGINGLIFFWTREGQTRRRWLKDERVLRALCALGTTVSGFFLCSRERQKEVDGWKAVVLCNIEGTASALLVHFAFDDWSVDRMRPSGRC